VNEWILQTIDEKKKKKKVEQYHIQDNYVPLQPLLGLCFVLGFFII